MLRPTLALTFHDPPGRMVPQLCQMLPVVRDIFGAIVVEASATSDAAALDVLRDNGADVTLRPSAGIALLGRARRDVMRRALAYDAPAIMYCDADRVLHWAQCNADELHEVARTLDRHDFTVLGRTPRAFASHPRIQRDTEAIINHVFATLSGDSWDITAAARGCSRRAAERLVVEAVDDTIGVDATWPLWARHAHGLTVGYRETEGLEFETADRFQAEVVAAGGRDRWIAALDADPALWAERLELARIEVAAMRDFRPLTKDE